MLGSNSLHPSATGHMNAHNLELSSGEEDLQVHKADPKVDLLNQKFK
jgi:hypothetical protein